MERELVLVNSEIYRPVIFKIKSKCGAAPRDANVLRHNVDADLARLLNNLSPNHFGRFSIHYREHYFLMNVIVELKSREIGRAILGPGEEEHNQHEQNENLPAAQAEHRAELYTAGAKRERDSVKPKNKVIYRR